MTLTRGGNLGIGITNPTHKLNVQGISTFNGNAHFGSNVTVDSDLTVGSNVTVSGSLSVPTISNSVSFGGTITATQFIGDGSGLTGVTGTGSGVEIQEEGFNVGTASTINFIGAGVTATISGGIASIEITTSGAGSSGVIIKDDGSTVGTASNIDFGGNLSVSAISAGIVTVTASGGGSPSDYVNVAGIATYTSEWTLGNNGTSHYTFTGPGLTGAENDPEIYLIRGQQYKFTNTMNAHPFKIQSTLNGSTPADSGTVYNDGITNNLVSNGTLTWDVQFDTPATLYYQCTSHSNMGGVIRILDAVTTNSSVTDVITISSSSNVLSAVDPGADRLVFWDESQNKLSYLNVGSNLTLNDDTISASASGISEVSADTTPQLGGSLDLNSKSITGTGNVNVTGVVTATSFSGDGSALTGVTASGSGIVVKDGGSVVGTASTIDFGSNLSVSAVSSGIVTVTASGGGGTLPSRTVVTGSTSSIINNATGNVNLTGFKSYALMKVGLSTAGWIKLYTDSTSRSNDASRSVGEDPTPGSGVIAEVVTTGISTQQNISPFVIGGNMNDPADSTIYVSITNLSGTTQVITANLTILQLEQ